MLFESTANMSNTLATTVCECYLVTFLNWTSLFDWCVTSQGSKNKDHKDTCLKNIGLHLQKKMTTHSIVSTIEKTYVFS